MEDRPGLQPRFLADTMLERLARWLRVLGYDVVFTHLSNTDTSDSRGRVILSRSRSVATPRLEGDVLFIESVSPLAQLSEVIERLQLHGPWTLFTRCLICNTLLVPFSASDTEAAVNTGAPNADRQCPSCGRRYWEGVHTRRMRAALRRALGPSFMG